MDDDLEKLLHEIRACRVCEKDLPLGPRPIIRAQQSAKIMIVGQAPGTRVHESGIPWDDRSGDRLREWLNVDKDTFYDDARIAIVPMGFCYPGVDKNGGDSPPRPECAPLWHDAVRNQLPNLDLIILVGGYAQKKYLGKTQQKTMTLNVERWREYAPTYFPTPHPSWRNTAWLKRNPWFEIDALPALRSRVQALL
ncbi:MAG: uracil-DNA glycosylase family protein [Proteobacteria bacterium]|nr:uracil-DNA glycosylase family protein [Pseudomonadota bacterium]